MFRLVWIISFKSWQFVTSYLDKFWICYPGIAGIIPACTNSPRESNHGPHGQARRFLTSTSLWKISESGIKLAPPYLTSHICSLWFCRLTSLGRLTSSCFSLSSSVSKAYRLAFDNFDLKTVAAPRWKLCSFCGSSCHQLVAQKYITGLGYKHI